MQPQEFVAADKTNIKVGSWIPAWKIGLSPREHIINFDAAGAVFRCAVIFNQGNSKYEAVPGECAEEGLEDFMFLQIS